MNLLRNSSLVVTLAGVGLSGCAERSDSDNSPPGDYAPVTTQDQVPALPDTESECEDFLFTSSDDKLRNVPLFLSDGFWTDAGLQLEFTVSEQRSGDAELYVGACYIPDGQGIFVRGWYDGDPEGFFEKTRPYSITLGISPDDFANGDGVSVTNAASKFSVLVEH